MNLTDVLVIGSNLALVAATMWACVATARDAQAHEERETRLVAKIVKDTLAEETNK